MAHTHTRTNTHAHTYIHTNTHAHTCILVSIECTSNCICTTHHNMQLEQKFKKTSMIRNKNMQSPAFIHYLSFACWYCSVSSSVCGTCCVAVCVAGRVVSTHYRSLTRWFSKQYKMTSMMSKMTLKGTGAAIARLECSSSREYL